jgi:hypothetical protein
MSSADAARAAVPISSARAEASRKNGAQSRGPRTPAGKARASRNALKHGLRAEKHVVLPREDAAEFAALAAAMLEELAPVGALQMVLARRVAVAAWRLARADRIETELFVYRCRDDGNLAIGLMRDGNGTRSIETLLRYRGAAQAELTRALRTLKALQAERPTAAAEPAPVLLLEPRSARAGASAPGTRAAKIAQRGHPIEPDAHFGSVDSAPPASARSGLEQPSPRSTRLRPNEPDQPPAGARERRGLAVRAGDADQRTLAPGASTSARRRP